MSFVGDIFGPIKDIFGTIFGIGSKVVSGVGGILQDSGIATLLTTITSITGQIDTLVSSFSSTIKTIVDPITSAVDGIANLAKDIQDKVVAPIVGPITTTINEIDGLTKTISTLVDQGIGGIAKIPGAIADALGGIEASWDRSTRQLTDANAKIVSEQLVPGLTKAIAPGLKEIAASSAAFTTPQSLALDRLPMLALAGDVDLDSIRQLMAKYTERFKNPTSIWDQVGAIALDLISFAPLIIGYFEAQAEEAREAGKAANPVSTLDPGTIQTLFQRRLIDAATAKDELSKSGYDETRKQALLDLTEWLPDIEQAGDFLRRGLITQGTYEKLVNAHGASGDDINALLGAMKALFQPSILIDMLARGIIDQVAFDDQLKAQGYTAEQIAQIVKAGIAPPSVETLIAARGNLLAAADHWFEGTYGAAMPSDIANTARASRIDTTQAAAQWTAHWQRMPVQTAVALFFRGEMNRDEVKIVVAQNDLPPDMTDLLIASMSTQVQPRTIPAMLARGTIDEAKARDILKAKGYSELDVNLLVEDALAQVVAKKKSAKSPATTLTVAELGTAYKDGVIDEETYRRLLASHDLTPVDIAYIVAVQHYELTKSQKAAHVATLKAEVANGTKTITDATAELGAAGFTGDEIARVQATMHQQRKAAAKLPSYADLAKGWLHGLLNDDTFMAGIQALGFAAPWDQFMFALAGLHQGGSSGPPPSGPAA